MRSGDEALRASAAGLCPRRVAWRLQSRVPWMRVAVRTSTVLPAGFFQVSRNARVCTTGLLVAVSDFGGLWCRITKRLYVRVLHFVHGAFLCLSVCVCQIMHQTTEF